MSATQPAAMSPTASELRKMTAEQRDAFLRTAAAAAEPEYRSNDELTAFEAFGPEDLHGDSASFTAFP